MRKITKITYSSGSIAAAISSTAIATYVLFYYVDTLNLNPILVGIGMTIWAVWNAINDILVGQLSDKTRSKWGRRIPFIIIGGIPLAITTILVWTPPFTASFEGGIPLLIYFTIILLLFDTFYTIVILPWTALFVEQFSTHEERTEVSSYRQIFSVIGVILGTAAPPIIYSTLGFPIMGLILGIVTGLFVYISIIGIHEREEFLADEPLNTWDALKSTFVNRSFITYVLGWFMIEVVIMTVLSSMAFYTKYVLNASDEFTAFVFLLAFSSALIFILIWRVITNKIGSRNAMIFGIIVFGMELLMFLFIETIQQLLVLAVLLGMGIAPVMLLPDLLIAEVIDEDELKTGVRREGMYFGANAFVIRLSTVVEAIIISTILTYFGYDSNLSVQPASVAIGLRLLVGAIPIIFIAIAIISYIAYPLHGDYLKDIKDQLEELHKKKKEKLKS